jgi:uncharacterized spore protein YtfJ
MDFDKQLGTIFEDLTRHASVESVFGDPIETNGRTVVPVARVSYGFGGGFGYGRSADEDGESSEGEGGGTGAGLAAKPVAVVEISDDDTRVIEFGSNRRSAALAALCLGLGYLLGRR